MRTSLSSARLGPVGLIGLILLGCGSSHDQPVGEGVSELRVVRKEKRRDGDRRHYLAVSFDLVLKTALVEPQHLSLRAACQVDRFRYLDLSPIFPGMEPGSGKFEVGAKSPIRAHPFVTNPLPGKPTMCDLRLDVVDVRTDEPVRELLQVCATDRISPGRCPANPLAGSPPTPPVTVDQLAISIDPASDLFPEALLLRYVVTAHADLEQKAWAHVRMVCAGAVDDVYHSELGELAAGESFHAGQLKFQGRIPPPSTPCDVIFTFDRDLDTIGPEFGHFCYRDGTTRRRACGAE